VLGRSGEEYRHLTPEKEKSVEINDPYLSAPLDEGSLRALVDQQKARLTEVLGIMQTNANIPPDASPDLQRNMLTTRAAAERDAREIRAYLDGLVVGARRLGAISLEQFTELSSPKRPQPPVPQ